MPTQSRTSRKERIDAFISSTSIDLPDYRTAVIKVLNTYKLHPNGMENWPVGGENPVALCKKMVEDSEIYIGIYAYRFGWQPDGFGGKSITELEFDWAADVIRNGQPIPRLCFIMSEDHPWPESKKEKGKQAELDAFKARVKAIHAGFFTTPDDLAKQLATALHQILQDRYAEPLTPNTRCVVVDPPPAAFAGRVDILTELEQRLTAGTSVAVTAVRAVGGMGKTSVAQKLAERLATAADRKFGIMLWAGIGQRASEETERAILRKWARDLAAIDLPDQEASKLAPQVTAIIKQAAQTQCGEPILLILDDVWPESLALAKRIRAVVPPGARVLVTTRSEDVAIDLDCADLALDKLDPPEGAQMLRNLIGTPDADRIDAAKLELLSATLGDYPLSLKLAARAVKRRKIGGIDAVIADLRQGLQDGSAFADLKLDAGDAKEDSVSVTLKQTLDTFSDAEQKQFRDLGALPMDLSFSRDHVYALWGAEDESTLEKCLLESLIEDAPEQPGRYQQHCLLRAYARGLLRERGELDDARRRHFRYIIAFAKDLFQDEKIETWDTFSADYPQVAAVGDELVVIVTNTRDPQKQDDLLQAQTLTVPEAWRETASDFANAVYLYVYRRNAGVDGRRWLWAGLVAERGSSTRRESLFLNQLGIWHRVRGYGTKALAYYEASLLIYRTIEDRGAEATTLTNIGTVYRGRGELDKALDFYQQALSILHAVGERAGEAATLSNIGSVYNARGELDKALDFLQQALPIISAVGDRAGEAATLNNIGSVYNARGELDKALDFYQQALPIISAVGDRGGEATTLNNIGGVYKARGELDKALDYYQQALPILQAIGIRSVEAVTCFNIGTVYVVKGDLDKAIEFIERCVQLEEQIGHPDLASDRQALADLKRKRDGGEEEESEDEEFARQVLAMYQAQGEAGVIAALKAAGFPDNVIANVIDQLRGLNG